MKISSHRLDRYAAIAACGSGAVGLAVSPLHGDIQYFGSEYTLNLLGVSTTSSTLQTISGGGVSWFLSGNRSSVVTADSFSTTLSVSGVPVSFQSVRSTSTINTAWFASGAWFGQNLFNAGDRIDSLATVSGTGSLPLHDRYYHRTFFASTSEALIGDFLTTSVRSSTVSSVTGAMTPGERGFLAIGFQLDGETVFGWADISLSTDGLSLTVHGWAFEDSGEAILAGQTEGGGTPVPGLGGLAALACGAAGMRRKRDRVA